jgi:hypothetical protein
MELLNAIDQIFLTRLFVGMAIYWIAGIFVKGIFEPIQAHLGKQLIILTNKKATELNNAAKLTCSNIDDFLLSQLVDKLEDLESLIKGNVPVDDRRLFRQLIAKNYNFEILLEKLDNIGNN